MSRFEINIEQIRAALHSHRPNTDRQEDQRQAAVAMLLTQAATEVEVLFIRRAEYDGDPWSGDVAFPGGGIEEQDPSPQHAAERETLEEVGLKLCPQQLIGQLDPLKGAYLPIQIYCFIYQLPEKPHLELNDEVVDFFWMPLQELLSPNRRKQATFEYRGSKRTHPIVDLDGYCEHFLWGITYRLFDRFFKLLGA